MPHNKLIHYALRAIAPAIGGDPAIDALPFDVVRELVTFPGEVIGLMRNSPYIRLRDAINGYDVYDRFMQYRYSIAYSGSEQDLYNSPAGQKAIIPSFYFGYAPQDDIFLAGVPNGSVFYIRYWQVQQAQTYERLLCVVMSPFDPDLTAPTDPLHGSVVRF